VIIKDDLKSYFAEIEEMKKNFKLGVDRELELNLDSGRINVIYGPRRAGKTHFLIQKFIKEGKEFIYLNFDDPRLFKINYKEILDVVDFYFELVDKEVNYIILDEVQNIKNWESAVKTLYELRKYKVFITGSSSKLLSKEIATQLRGRSISYLLLPFSFREFLKAKDFEFRKRLLSKKEISELRRNLTLYLNFGGFPEVVFEEDVFRKSKIIKEYLDLILFKDFIERFEIRNIKLAKLLMYYLITNFTKEITANSIFNKLNNIVKVGKDTVNDYLGKIEESVIVFFINKFDYKIHLRESWPKKVYLVDTGLSLPFRFSQDKGKLMENIVFLELKRKENENPFQEIYYYKTKNGKEIDFLVKDRNKIELIEVCYEFDEEHKKKLIKAMKELNLKESLCITWDEEGEIEEKGFKIKLVPLWKWLLL